MSKASKDTSSTPSASKKTHTRTLLWGLLAYRRNKRGEMTVRPVWKRIGILSGTLLVIAMVVGYFSMFVFMRHIRGWDFVSLWDIRMIFISPTEFRKKVGDHQYEQAKELLEAKNYREAIMHAQQAVKRSPSNREARILFAQMQASMLRRPDQAAQLLMEGLEYKNYDEAYLRTVMEILAYTENDEDIIRLYEFLQSQPGEKGDTFLLVQLAAANAQFNRGRFDEALRMLDEMDPRLRFQAELLRARVEWERGYIGDALQRLEVLYTRAGPEKARVAGILVGYYRELGRLKDAWMMGLQRLLDAPGDLDARIDYMLTLDEMGDQEAIRRQLESMWAGVLDERALDMLMMFAIRTQNYDLGFKVYNMEDKVSGRSLENGLRFAELNIVCGRFREALDILEKTEGSVTELPTNVRHFFDGLKAVAYQGLGQYDQRDIYINRFLESPGLRPAHYTAVATRMKDINAYDSAEKILTHALLRMYPNNRSILTQRLNLYLMNPNEQLVEDISSLLNQRRLPRDLLVRSYQELARDRFLFVPSRNTVLERLEQILSDYKQG
jgi:tetratricopeptide (TPR) repeat protein